MGENTVLSGLFSFLKEQKNYCIVCIMHMLFYFACLLAISNACVKSIECGTDLSYLWHGEVGRSLFSP